MANRLAGLGVQRVPNVRENLADRTSWVAAFVSGGIAMKLDYLWDGLCLVAAVHFIFRS